ncbi:MAG: hypothetical protein ACP5D6_11425 [Kosmotogaceae bacterium]
MPSFNEWTECPCGYDCAGMTGENFERCPNLSECSRWVRPWGMPISYASWIENLPIDVDFGVILSRIQDIKDDPDAAWDTVRELNKAGWHEAVPIPYKIHNASYYIDVNGEWVCNSCRELEVRDRAFFINDRQRCFFNGEGFLEAIELPYYYDFEVKALIVEDSPEVDGFYPAAPIFWQPYRG